jgi:hypothetical protein
VDSAGRLDAKTHGTVTLTATHEGRSASKTVQVVNNYEGSWAGQYVVRTCDWSGDSVHRGWCRGGGEWPIGLTLSQTDGNLSEITGTLALAWNGIYGEGGVTGSVTPDGRLNLAGSVNIRSFWDEPGIFLGTALVGAWDTRLGGPDLMTGRWAQNVRAGYAGNAYQEVELVTMTRTSTGAGPASASQTAVRSAGLLSRASSP